MKKETEISETEYKKALERIQKGGGVIFEDDRILVEEFIAQEYEKQFGADKNYSSQDKNSATQAIAQHFSQRVINAVIGQGSIAGVIHDFDGAQGNARELTSFNREFHRGEIASTVAQRDAFLEQIGIPPGAIKEYRENQKI